MTPEKYKAGIAALAEYYTVTPNDVQYKEIWNATKKFSDDYFDQVCEYVRITFNPTVRTPFPLVHNFHAAMIYIDENVKHPSSGYKRIEIPANERITHEEALALKNQALEIIRQGVSKLHMEVACRR